MLWLAREEGIKRVTPAESMVIREIKEEEEAPRADECSGW